MIVGLNKDLYTIFLKNFHAFLSNCKIIYSTIHVEYLTIFFLFRIYISLIYYGKLKRFNSSIYFISYYIIIITRLFSNNE